MVLNYTEDGHFFDKTVGEILSYFHYKRSDFFFNYFSLWSKIISPAIVTFSQSFKKQNQWLGYFKGQHHYMVKLTETVAAIFCFGKESL